MIGPGSDKNPFRRYIFKALFVLSWLCSRELFSPLPLLHSSLPKVFFTVPLTTFSFFQANWKTSKCQYLTRLLANCCNVFLCSGLDQDPPLMKWKATSRRWKNDNYEFSLNFYGFLKVLFINSLYNPNVNYHTFIAFNCFYLSDWYIKYY